MVSLGIIDYALLRKRKKQKNECKFRLWRNTQEAEEAPLLRV